MAEPAFRAATYADVLAAPEGVTAEILAGELYLSPRPAVRHSVAQGNTYFHLRSGFSGRDDAWWFLQEPELHLGVPDPTSAIAVPDVAAWRRSRLAQLPDDVALTLPPDWVAEILSPGAKNIRRDRILKPHLYASRGVPHLWIIDPVAQLLEVFRLQDGVYARIQAFAGDDKARAEPFEAVELELGGWWLPEDPPAP